MRFYIATGLVNAEHARKAAEVLRRNGHEQTYDWTTHGDIRHEGAERMSEVAFNELRAVRDAELVVALLPGGQGTHTELGVALATRSNKRIILWSETGDEFAFDNRTCTFYFHPAAERVVCPFEELLEILNTDRIDSASNTNKVPNKFLQQHRRRSPFPQKKIIQSILSLIRQPFSY